MVAGVVDCTTNFVVVGSAGKFHVDQGSALKVDAQRNVMPESDRQDAGDAEDQGEAKEVPLLPQEIDIRAFEKFQVSSLPRLPASGREY